MNVRNLFSKKTQEHLLSRRTALKGTLLGAAALFPFVEEVPGVSAASLGLNQSNVKALPLTGATLQQELKKLRVQPRCASAEAFVKQKGFEVTDVLAEGYYLYRKTGAHWSRETFLTLSYTSTQGASETAAITYMQSAHTSTLDIIHANLAMKTGEAYNVQTNGTVALVAQLNIQGDQSTLALSREYERALQANSVVPQDSIQCFLCRAVCVGISQVGCSILGAIFACGEVCGPFAENPICLAICGVAFRLLCNVGATGNCFFLVCVDTVHAC